MNEQMTLVVADGHVHVYPAYNPKAALSCLINNLGRLAAVAQDEETGPQNVFKLAFLAEGRDYDFFGRLQARNQSAPGDGIEVLGGSEDRSVTVAVGGVGRVCLLAGRQIVTSERLEILGLVMRAAIPDGLPAAEVIRRIVAADGIPVLAWSPGKWWFKRGRLARDLIGGEAPRGNLLRRKGYEGQEPRGVFAEPCDLSGVAFAKTEAKDAILSSIAASATEDPPCGKPQGFLAKKGDQDLVLRLGDTTLRPMLYPEPQLMKLARRRGLPVIPGSDPLPLAGEERCLGTYGFIYSGPFDAEQPAASIVRVLTAQPSAITAVGVRCGAWAVARRLYQLRKMKKAY